MKTFEYSCTLASVNSTGRYFVGCDGEAMKEFPSLNAALNAMGSEGWELVSYRRYTTTDILNGVQCEFTYEFFFKREKP